MTDEKDHLGRAFETLKIKLPRKRTIFFFLEIIEVNNLKTKIEAKDVFLIAVSSLRGVEDVLAIY